VISARADRSWRWYQAFGLYVPTVGGILLLVVAAITRDSNSIPLLVIGTGWIVIGLAALWWRPRVAHEVCIESGRIIFVFPRTELTVPVGDLVRIRRAWGDLNHWLWFRFETRSHGSVRVAARLEGLIELLAEIRRLNPGVSYPSL
jgi:hypothetical protein